MLAIGLGITVAVLDSAIANIALPTIARELRAAPAQAVWVINAYQLAIVVALLPLASLGERIGYRRVYIAGLAVFTLSSLGCALSHSMTALIVSRIAQGFGGAGIMAINGALVRFTYPRALLGRGVGLNALIVSSAAAVGPTVASGILSVGPWEWLFAVNVPIGIVNLLLASRALPHSDLSAKRFDWISAGLNALMFGLFFIGVGRLTQGGGGAVAALEIAASLIAGLALIRRETRRTQPLIPIDLMKIPVFALSVVTSVCSFTAYMLAFVGLPFYFESVLHRDAVQTGLLMTPWPVAVGLCGPLAGRLSDHVSTPVLGSAGLAALAIGLALLAGMPHHPAAMDIAWRMALCGAGFGFFQAPNNRTMLASTPRARAGAAGGMLATSRLTGLTIGASLAALMFSMAGPRAVSVDLVLGVGFAAAAAGVSLLRLSGSRRAAAL